MTDILDIGPLAEAAESEKRGRRGWPAGRPRGSGPAPTTQLVRPIHEQDIRDGAAALVEALSAAESSNGKLDIFLTVTQIFQRAGMISSRATPTPVIKKKEQQDGTLTCEIPRASDGNEASREAPGPS
jgi:hypothetical protein